MSTPIESTKIMEQRLANMEAGMSSLTTSVSALTESTRALSEKIDRFDELFISQARIEERTASHEQRIERSFDHTNKSTGRLTKDYEALERRVSKTEGDVSLWKGVVKGLSVAWAITVVVIGLVVKSGAVR